MAKREVIAIAFSDLHLNMWSKFNPDKHRTLNGFDVLFRIANICSEYCCPALFCGDLFHKPKNIDAELFDMVQQKFYELNLIHNKTGFRVYAISGNHDIDKVNTIEEPKTSWVSRFAECYDWLVNLDHDYVTIHGKKVYGIPYIDHNNGLNKYIKKIYADILLLHTDYPGATDTDGRVVDSAENLNINMFKQFKLVLCGHIHKPQRLGKKIYMVGAPQQQRRTDRNCKMGYLEIYDDLSVKFKYWDDYPKFIDVESQEDIKDDGNYYTVVPKSTREVNQTEHKITKQLSKKKLARLYMKQKGDQNKSRRKLLTEVLIKSEQC